MKPGYVIQTLGCRSNQFESACLSWTLEDMGFVQAGPDQAAENPVEVIVVNTCTVTHRADKQSRQLIRSLHRQHPKARIVATGCLARLEGESLLGLKGVSLVLGHQEQSRLKELLTAGRTGLFNQGPAERFIDLGSPLISGRTRALLKVQEGCNNACAYCRVRLARGHSRSQPFDQALAGAARLVRSGFREIVLTGIHLGAFGLDLDPPRSLSELVAALLSMPELAETRLRLSSLDPSEITTELLNAVQSSPLFCHHFHLPLQSGDSEVLKRMNRPYTTEFYADQVRLILDRLPEAAVGADVMVGFPGEDEASFKKTLELIETLPLSYLHVFPFSPRPGTKAFDMPDQPGPAAVRARAQRLRKAGQEKRLAFFKRAVGEVAEMLVESRRDPSSGLLTGVSANYLNLLLDGPDEWMNRLLKVRVESLWTGSGEDAGRLRLLVRREE